MKITFLGAAGEVTGSQHLIECGKLRVLLDCGLFQGRRDECRRKNEHFACKPEALDAVILSHAHVDHCGNLPGLYKAGYRGPIFCTEATASVAQLMMLDCAKIQEEDANYVNRHRAKSLKPFEPLYTTEHAEQVSRLFEPLSYSAWHELGPDLRVRFRDAGHILGSAIVEMEFRERTDIRRVVFTGDLGRRDLPVLRDPELVDDCEILITESTYANRIHPDPGDLKAALLRIIREAHASGGKVIIPAFSLGRTQNIVYFLNQLYNAGELPKLPVYVDSPLSRKLTAVHSRYVDILDAATREMMLHDDDPFHFPGLTYVGNQQESMALNKQPGPMVIIAASGMCESGRVVHHLKHGVTDPKNIILIVGYQAEHTLGRRLVEKRPFVRIFDHEYPLKARVETLNGLSAHADAADFKWWLEHLGRTSGISQAFIVHGERDAAEALAKILKDLCDHDPVVVRQFQTVDV